MTDKEIIAGLIARDEQITSHFFFKECRPLFISLIRRVFNYDVDYDECVNELYLYLVENDAYRLRQFEGRSSIYQWLKRVAFNFFVSKKRNFVDSKATASFDERLSHDGKSEATISTSQFDFERLLQYIPNRRYAYVLRRLVVQDAEPEDVARELQVSVDNLYNIKKRAISALTDVALNDKRLYERARSR